MAAAGVSLDEVLTSGAGALLGPALPSLFWWPNSNEFPFLFVLRFSPPHQPRKQTQSVNKFGEKFSDCVCVFVCEK